MYMLLVSFCPISSHDRSVPRELPFIIVFDIARCKVHRSIAVSASNGKISGFPGSSAFANLFLILCFPDCPKGSIPSRGCILS